MQAIALSPVHVRTAGALYLVIILCGLTAEIALRGPLLAGSPPEIAGAIGANLPQFRLSLLADVIMLLADIALALLFWLPFVPCRAPCCLSNPNSPPALGPGISPCSEVIFEAREVTPMRPSSVGTMWLS